MFWKYYTHAHAHTQVLPLTSSSSMVVLALSLDSYKTKASASEEAGGGRWCVQATIADPGTASKPSQEKIPEILRRAENY